MAMNKCKDCKWLHSIPEEYADKYKEYGRCLDLTMMDNVVFLQGGKEISGGILVKKSFGCIGFERE